MPNTSITFSEYSNSSIINVVLLTETCLRQFGTPDCIDCFQLVAEIEGDYSIAGDFSPTPDVTVCLSGEPLFHVQWKSGSSPSLEIFQPTSFHDALRALMLVSGREFLV